MRRYVLSNKNLPMRLPLWMTITILMALDFYHAPGWVRGVLYTLLALVWVAWVIDTWTARNVEVTTDLKQEWKDAQYKLARKAKEDSDHA